MKQQLKKWIIKKLQKNWENSKKFVRCHPIQTSLATFIVLLHFVVLCYYLVDLSPREKRKRSFPMRVRTVALNHPPKPLTRTKHVKKEVSQHSKPERKKDSLKQTNKKLKAVKQDKLLKEIQKKIASIEHKEILFSSKKVTVPEVIQELNIEKNIQVVEEIGEEDLAYEEELVIRLQLLLRLPEKGDVHIELTLMRNGTIDKLSITRSDSARNTIYIQNTLPSIIFPEFGSHFKGESYHDFSITLTSQV